MLGKKELEIYGIETGATGSTGYSGYKVFEKKWLGSLAVIVVLGLSLYYMAVSTNNPFLYFNF